MTGLPVLAHHRGPTDVGEERSGELRDVPSSLRAISERRTGVATRVALGGRSKAMTRTTPGAGDPVPEHISAPDAFREAACPTPWSPHPAHPRT